MKRTETHLISRKQFGVAFPEEWVWSLSPDGDGDGIFTNVEHSRESAIAEALASRSEQDQFTDHVYVAPVKEYCVGISAHRLIEDIDECAYDECGEAATDGIGANREQIAELQQQLTRVLGEWMHRHNLWPGFSRLGKIEQIPVGDRK